MSQQVAIPSEQVVADQHLVEDVVVKAKTSFYWAMRLLPAEKRQAMFAVYAFCRVVDDIADGDLPEAAKLRQLQGWREEIDRLYAGDARDPIARALIEPIRRFDLAREDFIAMIDGMETDARGGLIAPAMTDLELYCSRVAGAVGLLSVRIFEAPQKGRRELAHALQLRARVSRDWRTSSFSRATATSCCAGAARSTSCSQTAAGRTTGRRSSACSHRVDSS